MIILGHQVKSVTFVLLPPISFKAISPALSRLGLVPFYSLSALECQFIGACNQTKLTKAYAPLIAD